ncbi:MAG: translation initiation factor IF-2 subunit beta [Candidatus Aenigmarchaeota archaeon]|nr:translation initiation factor IF-2 subunit beta [Candidatus Aenigmarchaeota archaeon]
MILDMDYKELLKKARANLPVKKGDARFEMPRASVLITGRLTTVKNFSDLAKILRRDAKHVSKYLFKELAVPGDIKGGELVLQGKFSSSVINGKIENYAEEFVYCHECGKPDTVVVKTDRIEQIKCEACGARRPARHI